MITVALMIPHRLDYNLALKDFFLEFCAQHFMSLVKYCVSFNIYC
jgi:hypothetical protein